jgi:small-conductance mechanosensitive channel
MAIKPRLLKRILLLSVIFIVSELIYLGVKKEIISIDPALVLVMELFLTLIISLLIITVILRITEKKVWTMFEKEMEVEQRIIISKLYSISLYTIALFITFWKAGVSLGNLTLFIGLVTSGFAYALRDVLLSFFAWFIILNKKPFHMGDYIQVDNYNGLVTRIGTFFFTLEQQNNPEFIKIPNSIILNKPTINKGNGKYREEIKMPLKHAPADLQDRLKELQVFIRTRNLLKDPVKTHVVADTNGWYVYISFNTSFQQDNLKAAVYSECLQQLSDCLHFSS